MSHGEYSYFRLDRILKILTIALKKEEKEIPQTKVIFEVYNRTKSHYHEDANEKIIERTAEKVVVESVSKNKFNLVQKSLERIENKLDQHISNGGNNYYRTTEIRKQVNR